MSPAPAGQFLPGYRAPGYFTGAPNQRVIDARSFGTNAISQALNQIQADSTFTSGEAFIALPSSTVDGFAIAKPGVPLPQVPTYDKDIVFHLVGPWRTKEQQKQTIVEPNSQNLTAVRSGHSTVWLTGQAGAWNGQLHFWCLEFWPADTSCIQADTSAATVSNPNPPLSSVISHYVDYFDRGAPISGLGDGATYYYQHGFQVYTTHLSCFSCRFDHTFGQQHHIYNHRSPGDGWGPAFGPHIFEDCDFVNCGGNILQYTDRDRIPNFPQTSPQTEEGSNLGEATIIVRRCTGHGFGRFRGNDGFAFTFVGAGNYLIEDSFFWSDEQTYPIDPQVPPQALPNHGFIVVWSGTKWDGAGWVSDTLPRPALQNYTNGSLEVRRTHFWLVTPAVETSGKMLIQLNSIQRRVVIEDTTVLSDRTWRPILIAGKEDGFDPVASKGVKDLTFSGLNSTSAFNAAIALGMPGYPATPSAAQALQGRILHAIYTEDNPSYSILDLIGPFDTPLSHRDFNVS